MEPDQVNILALAMPRELQQIGDARKTRLPRQLWRDVRHADELDGIDFDLTVVHTVPRADPDMGAGPEPDAAGDRSAADSFPKTFREDHGEAYTRPERNALIVTAWNLHRSSQDRRLFRKEVAASPH